MNILSQIGKQLSDLFASMTPPARVMAALMAGVIVVSLGWILANQQNNNKSYIMGLLSPEQIRKAEEAFAAASLGDYEIVNRSRIQVPAAKKADYLRALSDGGAMPMQAGEKLEESLKAGIFDPPSLIAQRKLVARAQEFSRNLERLPQVEYASVAFDEQRKGFAQETEKVCAIYVESFGGRPIDIAVLKHICESATTYFAGLKKENVSVFDVGSANIYRTSSNGLSSDENPVLVAQASWENHYYQKVSDLLGHYGAVKLGVSVELDPKLMEETEKLQFDPKGVAMESSLKKSDSDMSKTNAGGRPGAAPNGVANQPQAITSTGPEQTTTTKESEESTRSLYGQEAVVTKMAGLVPKVIKISVGVPESYYHKKHLYRWQRDNPGDTGEPPAPTPQQLNDIMTEVEAAITSAVATIPVNLREGEDRKTFIDVYDYTDLPLPVIPGPTIADSTLAWLGESWSTVAMIALVLVSLFMMFSWVRSQPGSGETERRFAEGFGLKIPEQMGDELDLSSELDSSNPEGGERSKPEFEVTGQEMKEDLSTLIKENPDAAVNLLKTWIGEAA